jgi:hypothetical protein
LPDRQLWRWCATITNNQKFTKKLCLVEKSIWKLRWSLVEIYKLVIEIKISKLFHWNCEQGFLRIWNQEFHKSYIILSMDHSI